MQEWDIFKHNLKADRLVLVRSRFYHQFSLESPGSHSCKKQAV